MTAPRTRRRARRRPHGRRHRPRLPARRRRRHRRRARRRTPRMPPPSASARTSPARSSAARPPARSTGSRRAFSTATDAAAFVDCDLVIEAVPEDRALKTEALTRAERAMPAASVLATNTSSISIDDLAARAASGPSASSGCTSSTRCPRRPSSRSSSASATAAELVDAARGWIAAIGKTAVVVRDSPGFASSRLGLALGLEAIRMLEEGVAGAADIDAAMELGYRHPMGPLRTTDIVGLDVRLGIAEELARAARRAVRAARAAAPHGRRGTARPQERPRDSTNGRTSDDRDPAELRPGVVVDARRRRRRRRRCATRRPARSSRGSAPPGSISAPPSSTRAPSVSAASAR